MTSRIEVNYADIQKIVGQLSEASSESQQMMQRLKSQIEVLEGGAWIGVNANKFYQVMNNDVMQGVQRLINGLNEASSVANQIATNYENAEDQARGAFPNA